MALPRLNIQKVLGETFKALYNITYTRPYTTPSQPIEVETYLLMSTIQAHVQGMVVMEQETRFHWNSKDKNAKAKEMLAIMAQQVPGMAIAQKLTPVCLLLQLHMVTPASANSNSHNYSIKDRKGL